MIKNFILNILGVEEIKREAFIEGRNTAIDNAAMKAYDMGHPEIRIAINALIDR